MSQPVEVVNLDEGLAIYDDITTYEQLRDTLWKPVDPPLVMGQRADEVSDPELPPNLDTMWLDDLRQVQKELGRWLGYVCDQRILVMIAVGKLKAQMEFVKDFLYRKVYTKGTQREREAAINMDRSYMTVYNNYLSQKLLLAALTARMEKLRQYLDIVSRQITIVMGNPENESFATSNHHEDD